METAFSFHDRKLMREADEVAKELLAAEKPSADKYAKLSTVQKVRYNFGVIIRFPCTVVFAKHRKALFCNFSKHNNGKASSVGSET